MSSIQRKILFVSSSNGAARAAINPFSKEITENKEVTWFEKSDIEKFLTFLLNNFAYIGTGTYGQQNLSKYIEFFGSDWVIKYVEKRFNSEKKSVNDLQAFNDYITTFNNKNKDVDMQDVLHYLESIIDVANSLNVNEIFKTNDTEKEKIISNMKKHSGNKNPEISSTIENPRALKVMSEQLGKKYDASKMLSAKKDDEKILLYSIHERVYKWLKDHGLSGKIKEENASTITKATLKKIIDDNNHVKFDSTNLTTQQIRAGFILGLILDEDVTKAQKNLAFPKNSKLVKYLPSYPETSIYRQLIISLSLLFTSPDIYNVFTGKYDEDDDTYIQEETETSFEDKSENIKFKTLLPFYENLFNNYTNAQKEDKNSTKYNLYMAIEKLRKLDTLLVKNEKISPKEITDIVNRLLNLFITKRDYIGSQKLEDTKRKNKNKIVMRLKEWQEMLVTNISEGKSVIAIGPTSGGKTLSSMFALDILFRESNSPNLIYVAPNYYQAFQAFSNLVKTFPTRNIAFISESINDVPQDCKVWVGTPSELLTYIESANISVDICILDEIHTISTSYGSTNTSMVRSTAIVEIIKLVKKQLIGLSATIHDEDIGLLVRKLTDFTNDRFPFEEPIIYTERPVELIDHIFDGNDIVRIKQSHPTYDEITDHVSVTPENTFKLMKNLSERKQVPALIFDKEEANSYTFFNELINYLNSRFKSEYVSWINLNKKYSADIVSFNDKIGTLKDFLSDFNEKKNEQNDSDTGKKAREKSKNNKNRSDVDKLQKAAIKEKKVIISKIEKDLIHAILTDCDLKILSNDEDDLPESYEEEKVKVEEAKPKRKLVKLTRRSRKPATTEEKEEKKVEKVKLSTNTSEVNTNTIGKSNSKKILLVGDLPKNIWNLFDDIIRKNKSSLPKTITPQTKDLLIELLKITKIIKGGDSPDYIDQICEGTGSYFKLSEKYNPIFENLLNPKIGFDKEYNFMTTLTESEGARASDVNNIFRLMDLALSFGIGILLPSMPFSVQYQVLKMLDEKELDFVFVSMSMSMGVNFSARTTVLRCENMCDLNVCEAMQMKGRAGRWGHITDEFALSITWNVQNAKGISLFTMPEIIYPVITKNNTGKFLIDPEGAAEKIVEIMLSVDNLEILKSAIDNLKEVHTKMVSQKAINKSGEVDLGNEDDDYTNVTNEEKTKDRKIVKKNVNKIDGLTNDTTLTSSIVKCVSCIGEHIGMDASTIEKLTIKVQDVCVGNDRAHIYEDSYFWAERIKMINRGLRELHMIYHRKNATKFLNYITTLDKLINRAGMRYIGAAFEPKKDLIK